MTTKCTAALKKASIKVRDGFLSMRLITSCRPAVRVIHLLHTSCTEVQCQAAQEGNEHKKGMRVWIALVYV